MGPELDTMHSALRIPERRKCFCLQREAVGLVGDINRLKMYLEFGLYTVTVLEDGSVVVQYFIKVS